MGSKVKNEEKVAVGRKTAKLIRANYADHALIASYAAGFENVSDELEAVVKPRAKGATESGLATGLVNEKDEVRDDCYRAFFYLLLAYSYQRHDPVVKAIAQALLLMLVPKQLAVVDWPNAQESTELETLLAIANDVAEQLASVPEAPAFLASLRKAQDEFKAAVETTPTLRQALLDAVKDIHEKSENWDGVLQGFLGILRQAYPGNSAEARAEREKLLGPLRAAQAAAKTSATARKKTRAKKAAEAGTPGTEEGTGGS